MLKFTQINNVMAKFYHREGGRLVEGPSEPKIVLEPSILQEQKSAERRAERDRYIQQHVIEREHARILNVPGQIEELRQQLDSYASFEDYRVLEKFRVQDRDGIRAWNGGPSGPNEQDWRTARAGLEASIANMSERLEVARLIMHAMEQPMMGSPDRIASAERWLAGQQSHLQQDYDMRHQILLGLYQQTLLYPENTGLQENYRMKAKEEAEAAWIIRLHQQARQELADRRADRASLFEES